MFICAQIKILSLDAVFRANDVSAALHKYISLAIDVYA